MSMVSLGVTEGSISVKQDSRSDVVPPKPTHLQNDQGPGPPRAFSRMLRARLQLPCASQIFTGRSNVAMLFTLKTGHDGLATTTPRIELLIPCRNVEQMLLDVSLNSLHAMHRDIMRTLPTLPRSVRWLHVEARGIFKPADVESHSTEASGRGPWNLDTVVAGQLILA